ncbi:MAG TPA: extracellular solute-binding protein [Clostridia bacterium]|nr:extracellular solute-binding protein [Clostridia bacterium]
MKMLRLVLAALLVVSMIFSVAACGNATQTDTASTAAAGSSDAAATVEAASTAPAVEKDAETGLTPMADRSPFTYTLFIRDPGQAPSKDNPVLKKITELTGVTVDFQFLVGDLNEKVGVLLAGGDYPDVMFGAEAKKFFDAGALIPVEDYINKYPNLKAHYAPFMKSMIAALDGKHAYCVENYNAFPNTTPPIFNVGGVGFFMQKAVVQDSGYKIPKTLDEYFKMLEDYKAKYPTIDGAKTIGFEILCDGWRDFCLRNPAQHLMGAGNDGDAYVDPNTLVASLYQNTDTAKAYYLKLNEEYRKGIIEAETFTENYDQYIARLSTGAVLGMFDQAWNFGNGTNALNSAGKFERTYVAVPITNPGVKDNYIDPPAKTISGTGGLTVSTSAKNPDRIFAFWDWLLNPEVQNYLQWGIEGKDWTKVGTVGKALTKERRDINRDNAKRRDTTGDTLWQYTPKMQGLYDDGAPCGPGDSADEYLASQSEFDQKFLKDMNIQFPAQILSTPTQRPAYYPVWSFPLEDGSPAKVATNKIADTCRKYYPQLILSDPSKFDALWDKFLKEIESDNPNAYLDEINKQIKAKMELAKQ